MISGWSFGGVCHLISELVSPTFIHTLSYLLEMREREIFNPEHPFFFPLFIKQFRDYNFRPHFKTILDTSVTPKTTCKRVYKTFVTLGSHLSPFKRTTKNHRNFPMLPLGWRWPSLSCDKPL